MEDEMKAPIKIISLITAGILACGLVGCGGNTDNGSSADNTTENTESAEAASDTAATEAEDEFANGYVECDGEKMDINDWYQMFSTNPLAMDNYLGKEITAVSNFQSISSDTLYYTNEDGKYDTLAGNTPKYEAPVGLLNLEGFITADIPESDRALASSFKPGDKVKVSGTISGWFSSTTLLLLPSSGAEYTGDITIEKIS